MESKRNLALYIDGENISAKKGQTIIDIIKKEGNMDYGKVYHRQKDNSTVEWFTFTKTRNEIKNIQLSEKPEKNKVDNKIKKDIRKDINNAPNIDIIVIASSDHDYIDIIEQVRKIGKRVIVIGEKKAPEKLRKAASKFIQI